MHTISTVEYHVAGHAVRVITNGVPSGVGLDAGERATWFEAHADELRRAILAEPRGHEDLLAVALTDTSLVDAHAGLLFLDGVGYPVLALPAAVAAATACVERGLLIREAAANQELVFDTGFGLLRAVARTAPAPGDLTRPTGRRVSSVSIEVSEVFVHTPSATVQRGGRRVPIDIAFGGGFYAVVDSEAAGVPLDRAHVTDLRRAGLGLCQDIAACFALRRPGHDGPQPLDGVVLTGPPMRDTSHLRSAVISRHGIVDRSSLSGAAAVLAVLAGMGLAGEGQPFVQEGLSGLSVEAVLRERLGGAVVPDAPVVTHATVTATPWLTGEQTWVLHDADPLRHGWVGA